MAANNVCVGMTSSCPYMCSTGSINVNYRFVFEFQDGNRSSGASALNLRCQVSGTSSPLLYVEFQTALSLGYRQYLVLQQQNLANCSSGAAPWEDVTVYRWTGSVWTGSWIDWPTSLNYVMTYCTPVVSASVCGKAATWRAYWFDLFEISMIESRGYSENATCADAGGVFTAGANAAYPGCGSGRCCISASTPNPGWHGLTYSALELSLIRGGTYTEQAICKRLGGVFTAGNNVAYTGCSSRRFTCCVPSTAAEAWSTFTRVAYNPFGQSPGAVELAGPSVWGSTNIGPGKPFSDPLAKLIWYHAGALSGSATDIAAYLTTTFTAPSDGTKAVLTVIVDDEAEVFLNGAKIGTVVWGWGFRGSLPGSFNVTLAKGSNTLTIRAWNHEGPSALMASLVTADSSRTVLSRTSSAWTFTLENLPSAAPGRTRLPDDLNPEVLAFDAYNGVILSAATPLSSPRPSVTGWLSTRSGSTSPTLMNFQGNCSLSRDSNNKVADGITFDGASCIGVADGNLPSTWSGTPTSAFTAIWIGRLEVNAYSGNEQIIMTLSRNQTGDVDHELFWSTLRRFTFSYATQFMMDIRDTQVPSPPVGQWTMEALVRHDGATAASYYRCGWTATRSWKQLPSKPCGLDPDAFAIGGDLLVYVDKRIKTYLNGKVAVVLLYNRALSQDDITRVAAVYAPRFGWLQPQWN